MEGLEGGCRAPSLPSSLPAPSAAGPGIVAAAGVVNQADDKRFLQSGYFTTPGLHHTTRFALRLPLEPSCVFWSISDCAVFNRPPPLKRLICAVLGKSAVLMKHRGSKIKPLLLSVSLLVHLL